MSEYPKAEDEVTPWTEERLRWMAFLAGWSAATPQERPDPAEIHEHYRAWWQSVGSRRG